jgi:hypothetical protein
MMKLKTWQWIFVGVLAVLTIASIIAEFSMHEDHGAPHKTSEKQETYNQEYQVGHEHEVMTQDAEQYQGGHWQSGIPLFWIWFGFFGCVALIVLAKNVLAHIIYKEEDYYNE